MTIPVPDYRGACITNVMPAVALALGRNRGGDAWPSEDEVTGRIDSLGLVIDPFRRDWIPKAITEASQVVVLVIDGLGQFQLRDYAREAPVLASLNGSVISAVAPTTTATALTSIASGLSPIDHGILGYRMRLGTNQVFNSLLWSCPDVGTRISAAPGVLRIATPFLGLDVAIVSKAQYSKTGFTRAYLGDSKFHEFRHASTMVAKVKALLQAGKPMVYTYYEGLDSVAHEYGFSDAYREELHFVDFLVSALIETLPKGAALVITADHGQVEVPSDPIRIDARLEAMTVLKSGEGRFRWLHLRSGTLDLAKAIATDLYGEIAWVLTRSEALEAGLFGPVGNYSPYASRLGDLALIARSDVAFYDATDRGPLRLLCRHGSMTPAETQVPLVGYLAM